MEETKEFKAVKGMAGKGFETAKHLWTVPLGQAGLLVWLVALVCALDKPLGVGIGFGVGLWFVYRANKELKKNGQN